MRSEGVGHRGPHAFVDDELFLEVESLSESLTPDPFEDERRGINTFRTTVRVLQIWHVDRTSTVSRALESLNVGDELDIFGPRVFTSSSYFVRLTSDASFAATKCPTQSSCAQAVIVPGRFWTVGQLVPLAQPADPKIGAFDAQLVRGMLDNQACDTSFFDDSGWSPGDCGNAFGCNTAPQRPLRQDSGLGGAAGLAIAALWARRRRRA